MILQTFKTECESCGEEMESKAVDMTGTNEIIIDFINEMEFECQKCGATTYIEINKFTE